MNDINRIKEELAQLMEGEAWYGPTILDVLSDVDAKMASARPLMSCHSIWEIVLHVKSAIELVIGRLNGEPIQLSPEENWPPVPADVTAENWHEVVVNLRRDYETFLKTLEHLEDARLDKPIVPGFSSTYKTLLGLAQHNAYHSGQITLLKKSC